MRCFKMQWDFYNLLYFRIFHKIAINAQIIKRDKEEKGLYRILLNSAGDSYAC